MQNTKIQIYKYTQIQKYKNWVFNKTVPKYECKSKNVEYRKSLTLPHNISSIAGYQVHQAYFLQLFNLTYPSINHLSFL